MPALVAGIHVLAALQGNEDVDGQGGAPRARARGDPDKPGHDELGALLLQYDRNPLSVTLAG